VDGVRREASLEVHPRTHLLPGMCVFVSVCVCFVCVCVCVEVHERICFQVDVCVCVCMFVCIYMHIYNVKYLYMLDKYYPENVINL